MKKPTGIIAAILLIILIGSVALYYWFQATTTSTADHIENMVTDASLADLSNKVSGSVHTVQGFVIDTFTCPPCEPGWKCEPCPTDHITVASDLTISPEEWNKVIKIETDQIEKLKVGKEYYFRVEKLDTISTLQFRLIDFTQL